MSRYAWAYILSVLLAGATLTGLALSSFTPFVAGWSAFIVLATLATVAQLFEAEHGHQSYYPHFVFFFAGALLLHPFLFVLVVTIAHLVEWAKARLTNSPRLRNWYIQPFNIANHIIAGSTAFWTYKALEANPLLPAALASVIAAVTAALAYVIVNHALVGLVLLLARKVALSQSGVLQIESLLPDFIMSCLGFVVSVLWGLNPWLIAPALSPLVLMYQALMVPKLKEEAQTDAKTGLLNARRFAELATAEIGRARRFNRPLTLIMADLDLLRNINNTYGHLAGDTVLAGIGKIIRDTMREYDIAGRFGGEEFALVLPEVGAGEAQWIAERLRAAVEAAQFEVATSSTPIHATMSFGVASFPSDAVTLNDLIHEADIAVYQAKLRGRNCVVCASEIPHSVKLELGTVPLQDRLPALYSASATPPATPLPLPAANVRAIPRPDVESALTVSGSGQQEVILASPAAGRPAVTANQGENEQLSPTTPVRKPPQGLLWLFLSGVIATGLGLTILSVAQQPRLDLAAVGLLVALAIAAELLKIDVYGENTISVSLALNFAAALISGLPGVALVSAAIVLAHRLQQRPLLDRAALYKTAFNWSTHVLAGSAPVLAVSALGVPFQVSTLPLLLLPVTVAAVAYYVIDTGLIATAISLSKGASLASVWRGQFEWLANHYLALCIMGLFLSIAHIALGWLGVLVFALPVFMMRYSQKQYVEQTEKSVKELQRLNEELVSANREVVEANRVMQQLNEELFLTLSKIIDARDPYVGSHAAQVGDYALAIAIELEMPAERLEPLRQAGFLHDIGKIAISEQVLQKPDRLTDEEYEYVKTHAALGGEFLETSRALRHLAPFVRHHHERWDGKGYPDGLQGEQIPLEARILAVCDAAEAMASDRPYRRGIPIHELLAEIKRCAGAQFDPAVAAAFVRVVERDRAHLIVNSAEEVQRKQASSLVPAELVEVKVNAANVA